MLSATFWARKSVLIARVADREVRVVHIIRDAVPGLVLVFVLAMAALPAERIAASSTRGRARTAVAYLAGFGRWAHYQRVVATFAALRRDPQALGALALLGSFVGPFVGLVRAGLVVASQTPEPSNSPQLISRLLTSQTSDCGHLRLQVVHSLL